MAIVSDIYLDTEAFVRQNFNFGGAAFQSLATLVRHGGMKIHITRISDLEIRAIIHERAQSVYEHYLAFVRETRQKHISELPMEYSMKSLEEVEQELQAQYDNFCRETELSVIECGDVSVNEVFKAYFAGRPPFADKKNKNQFPDAFSTSAILEQIRRHRRNRKTYVVSHDGQWEAVFAGMPEVTFRKNIHEVLTDFVDTATVFKIASCLLPHMDTLEARLIPFFEGLNFHTQYYEEGEVKSISIHQVTHDSPVVMLASNGAALVHIDYQIEFEAELEFAMSQWNEEDGPYYGLDSPYQTIDAKHAVGVDVHLRLEDGEDAVWVVDDVEFDAIDVGIDCEQLDMSRDNWRRFSP